MMANTMIKWVTLTYYLFGTIICVSLYLLKRYTTVNVIEQENMFTKSPNTMFKTVPITMVSSIINELPPKVDIDFEMKDRELHKDKNGNECSDEARANSIMLLNELVAAKMTQTDLNDDSQMQKPSEHVVPEDS